MRFGDRAKHALLPLAISNECKLYPAVEMRCILYLARQGFGVGVVFDVGTNFDLPSVSP